MRENKFRAWDKKSRKMREVESIGFGTLSYTTYDYPVCNMKGYDIIEQKEIIVHRDKPHFELMQCTGKKDKNKNDIYDGDIVKCYVDTDDNGNDIYFFYKVVWHEIYYCWMFSIIQTTEMENEFIEDEFFDKYNSNDIEVIGNIFENPELLDN